MIELASSIIRILGNVNLARDMGETGREIALANFSEEAFTKKFLDLYQQIQTD